MTSESPGLGSNRPGLRLAPELADLRCLPARVSGALAGVWCAVALAACGGSSSAQPIGTTNPTGASSPTGLSHCMRAHGVPNFPDPRSGPGGEGLSISKTLGSTALTVFGITFSGPAFDAAEKACKKFLPGAGAPPPPFSASQKAAAIANARCMRAHGVPNFPDPRFPSGGGIEVGIDPGLDPQAPVFQHAAAACGGPGFRIHVR